MASDDRMPERTMLIVDARGRGERLPASLYALRVDMTLMRPTLLGVNGMPHNPSIVVHDGRLHAVVRVLFFSERTSHNVIGHINDDWQLAGSRLMVDRAGGDRNRLGMSRGFEDCRLVSWKFKLFATATACDLVRDDPKPKIAVLDLDEAGDVVRARVQPSHRHEKNWMPVVDGERLRFVYSVMPPVVLDFDDDTGLVSPSACDVDMTTSVVRGGSQLIAYGGGYIAVVHEVHRERAERGRGKDAYTYLHRFALFDRDVRLVRMSEPFYFRDRGIEFCAGLAEWRGSFVMSFGSADREACLAVVHRDIVQRMIQP